MTLMTMLSLACSENESPEVFNEQGGMEASLEIGGSELTLNGNLSVHISLPGDDTIGDAFLERGKTIPSNQVYILPRQLRVSGSVWIASDNVSDPIPIPSEVWALDKSNRIIKTILSDQDPFSREQFLLLFNPWKSTFNGQKINRNYDILSYFEFLPPFRFRELPVLERYQLTLPPESEIRTLSGQIWIDETIGLAAERLNIGAYIDNERVSTLEQTDERGQFSLALWSQSAGRPLTLKITPPQFPHVNATLPMIEVNALLPLDRDNVPSISIHYPTIGPLLELPVNISDETDFNGWQALVDQKWSISQPIGNARFKRSSLLSVDGRNAIKLYNAPATVYIIPPDNHPRRIMRIEVPDPMKLNQLRILAPLKVAVRGHVKREDGTGQSASINAQQVRWPWPESLISASQASTVTDRLGRFSLNLTPGDYALSIQPTTQEYAPRVTHIKVRQAEGLILSDAELTVKQGKPIIITAIEESLLMNSPHLSYKLFCDLNLFDAQSISSGPDLIPLSKGVLSLQDQGTWSKVLYLNEEVCPSDIQQ